ncbi:SDR family NAD(P)-dependent oxidoreductase [Bombilactobacillus thymidiniphilus]|uniref:SDR family NAD(P)-dependent oxidoreductase n=1 Tax=Bombilactobacillus thymidiniphilus TaxID=2923363 RepID=A0ABY4PD75_9LACO|nr:SDR family NAD(P)-dependent oxidoreductase [Bombilactobacillus thymidiniphilus]UQS83733.1 SDR family NAD(P)-dependent oxidoreductase [Bombilactobacillus thymidiniphilus]
MNISALKHIQSQNIIITGASSGIGRQLALQLATKNANLILVARRQEQLLQLQKQCQALTSGFVDVYVLDVSIAKRVEATIAEIKAKYQHIEVLINAAGFGDFTNFVETDYSLWNKIFKVNVLGTMLMTRFTAQLMMEQCLGQIINIGSMAGKIATPKSAIYSASKAAVIAFSDSLRLELRPFDVQVTTVNPGPVATDFFKIADHTGKYLQNVGQIILDPQKLANEIIACIGRPVRELNQPSIMQFGSILYKMFPHFGDLITMKIGDKK